MNSTLMKLTCVWILLLTLLAGGIAESNVLNMEDELPEGVYIYSPAADRFLPWTHIEERNVFQIIGLAPHDSTVKLSVAMGDEVVWKAETMSEGNGYFYAEIPSELLDVEPDYQLTVTSGYYSSMVTFFTYNGTVSEFAADPLHLAFLEDLTAEEKYMYESEMAENASDSDEDDALDEELVARDPNEYRNAEYSYVLSEDNTATLIAYHKHESDLVLPSMVDGYPVTGIQFGLLNRVTGVKTVTIPNEITEMRYVGNPFVMWTDLTAIHVSPDHPAFSSVNGTLYSRDLEEVIAQPHKHPEKEMMIPDGTRSVGHAAFYNSTIRKVEFPESVRELGLQSFAYSRLLKTVDLTDGIRILGQDCFQTTGLLSLQIPSKASANAGIAPSCPYLQEITVMPGNETLKSIDGVLFSADGETLLNYPAAKAGKKYRTPDKTIIVGEWAFAGASNLESVELSSHVTEIQESAFEGCSIKTVKLPNSLTTMNGNVFINCKKLEEIVVNKNHPTLSAVDNKYLYSKDHTIFYCYPGGIGDPSDVKAKYKLEKETLEIQKRAFTQTKIRGVILPEGLKKIEDQAFYGSLLLYIYVPGTVEEIGRQAFSQSNLMFMGLGEGVKEIGAAAFAGSEQLQWVAIPESVRKIGEIAFYNTGKGEIFTTEGSYAHQYALQNAIEVDTEDGKYEEYIERIKNAMGIGQTNTSQKIRIKSDSGANIRQQPDTDSRRLGSARKGSEYNVIDVIYNGEKVAWYRVELEDGGEGYIHGSLAELID